MLSKILKSYHEMSTNENNKVRTIKQNKHEFRDLYEKLNCTTNSFNGLNIYIYSHCIKNVDCIAILQSFTLKGIFKCADNIATVGWILGSL